MQRLKIRIIVWAGQASENGQVSQTTQRFWNNRQSVVSCNICATARWGEHGTFGCVAKEDALSVNIFRWARKTSNEDNEGPERPKVYVRKNGSRYVNADELLRSKRDGRSSRG